MRFRGLKLKSLGHYFFEIAIIFFGITLSFIFDEWRQSLKNKDWQREYYNLLISDIRNDSTNIANLMKWVIFGEERIDALLANSGNTYSDVSKFSKMMCVNYAFKDEQRLLNSFEAIKNNGHLGLINNEISYKCNKIIALQERFNKNIKREEDIYLTYIKHLRENHLKLSLNCTQYFGKDGNLRTDITPEDTKKYLADPEVLITLSAMYSMIRANKITTNAIIEELSTLKTLINSELE